MNAPRSLSVRNKFRAVAAILREERGSLLDVGARDRALAAHLAGAAIDYRSADAGEGHDHRVDLELPLPFPDRSFDHVVALDVLEHVENIHAAFSELARVAGRRLVVALPNMATLPRRWTFLWRGHLGTAKYDLLPQHQGDRHRWITVLPQCDGFIEARAREAGWKVELVIDELDGGPVLRLLGWALLRAAPLPREWFVGRSVYVLVRG